MDFSIIIPCYNSGEYLPDALESIDAAVKEMDGTYEVIIADDGSRDEATRSLLRSLEGKPHLKIVYRENGGPGAARNSGVKVSTGRNLIFLDSDNKLKPWFITKTLEVQQRTGADIVHGPADFFGDTTAPRFYTGPFDIHKMVVQNYIDICCLVKRELFEKTGGFDEERLILGFEDWEFFLHAATKGAKFAFVPEPIYDYRILGNSVSQQHSWEKMQQVRYYVYRKHVALVADSFQWYVQLDRTHQTDRNRPFRSFLKFMYRKYVRPLRG